jgi:DNA modification methylase
MAFMPENRNKRSVWSITTQPYKGSHFATFPLSLVEPCILAGCSEGGVVLDPFGGSGTVGEFCRKNNRDAILIELNPKYKSLINQRAMLGYPELSSFT